MSDDTRVAQLTDLLVDRYTPYANAREYYSHYTLTPEGLADIDIPARILASEDDPVIPQTTLRPLTQSARNLLHLTQFGGHCAFIKDFALRSALDDYVVNYFEQLH